MKKRTSSFSTEAFPEILKYKGQDILFTDGTTLLGADDKPASRPSSAPSNI